MPNNSQNPATSGSEERLRQILEQRRGVERDNERVITELVSQMQEAQQEAETALGKLSALSIELRGRAQRYPTETSYSYLVYANAHHRFAGAAIQGMKRTAATSRILDRAKAEQEDRKRREELEKERQAAREKREAAKRLQAPVEDDFLELYGEVVANAD
jgi:hypothetical protein